MSIKTIHHASWLKIVGALALALPGVTLASGNVKVKLSEWDVGLQADGVTPGKVTFVVRNNGHYTHAFEIERDGQEVARTEGVSPGESVKLTTQLKSGEYEVYCPIDGHKSNGMDTTVHLDDGGLSIGTGGSSSSESDDDSGYY